jgi:hypothetical protein
MGGYEFIPHQKEAGGCKEEEKSVGEVRNFSQTHWHGSCLKTDSVVKARGRHCNCSVAPEGGQRWHQRVGNGGTREDDGSIRECVGGNKIGSDRRRGDIAKKKQGRN